MKEGEYGGEQTQGARYEPRKTAEQDIHSWSSNVRPVAAKTRWNS